MTAHRFLGAAVVAGLGTLVLASHVFISIPLIRAKIVETPRTSTGGAVQVTTADFPDVDELQPPFALIARVTAESNEEGRFTVSVDGVDVCGRTATGGASRRIDCAVTTWRQASSHLVTITGPSTPWTLDYLEVATHHGNTSGAHFLVILPASSTRYLRPAPVSIALAWLVLMFALVTPAPRVRPRPVWIVWVTVTVLVVAVLAACLVSNRVSDFRVVIFRDTFVLWIALLLVPRLWGAGRWLARAEQQSRPRWIAVAEGVGLRALVPWLPPLAVAGSVVAVVAIGLLKGAFVAGGSDVYGYVSQAHLWARGAPRVEQPFMNDMRWPASADALAPLGYRPAVDGPAIVPIYSPGYPMLMAVFQWLGGRGWVFVVVPLLGGLTVWATYLMGSRLGGPAVGVPAAVLIATSPPFLFQLMFPMSDVPVTAWWALALALVVSARRTAVLAAGVAAGAAILTRPNLVPLAAVPGAFLLWQAVRERTVIGLAAQRVALFGVGVIAASAVVALINARLYGSPWISGYGSAAMLFSWTNLLPNLARYPRWLIETETPLIVIAFLAPLLVKSASHARGALSMSAHAVASMWAVFAVTVFLSYLFFRPFDGWFWLRYVLPAFPPLLVLFSVSLTALIPRVTSRAPGLVAVAVVAALAWYGASFAVGERILDFKEGEQKTVLVGEYIARALSERAVFISMQQSGSIRYYSGRLTVRYDFVPPELLDSVIADLRRLGYVPYILLEDWEESAFRDRFGQHSSIASLDWSPVAWVDHPTIIRIYDPADQARPLAELHGSDVIR